MNNKLLKETIDLMFDNSWFDFLFNAMFTIVPILIACVFIFVFVLIFSPKLRAKMIGLNIKTAKYAVEDNKENLVDIGTAAGDIIAQTGKNVVANNRENVSDIISSAADAIIDAQDSIFDENGDKIDHIISRRSDIRKQEVASIARGIKDGLTNTESIFCKHCGATIDADSKFCKKCGQEQ